MKPEKESQFRASLADENERMFAKDLKKIDGIGRSKKTALAIFNILKKQPKATVPELVEFTGISKQAITNTIKKLVKIEILKPLTNKFRYQVYCYSGCIGEAGDIIKNGLNMQNKQGCYLAFSGREAAVAQGFVPDKYEEKKRKPKLTKIKFREDAWHNKRPCNQNSRNSLYVCDNIEGMRYLIQSVEEKYDLIFADPPFNQITARKTRVYKDTMDQHSGYLQFMYPRLMLAKRLLSEKGLLIIAISETELSHTKLICNEIFGEENYLNCVSVESGVVAGVYSGYSEHRLPSVKQYSLLIYAKDHTKINFLNRLYDLVDKKFATEYNIIITEDLQKESLLEYLNKEQWVKDEFKDHSLKMTLKNIDSLMQVSQRFETYIYETVAKLLYKSTSPFQSKELLESIKNQPQDVVFVSDDKRYLIKTKDNTVREFKPFINRVQEDGLGIQRGDIWKGFQMYKSSEKNRFGITFEGRKQIRMLQDLLHWINNKNARVLDIFAGSGSMGGCSASTKLERWW